MRIAFATLCLIKEMRTLEAMTTNNVAKPKPNALVTVLVTASKGHKPNN